jgi:hypothetical protein
MDGEHYLVYEWMKIKKFQISNFKFQMKNRPSIHFEFFS